MPVEAARGLERIGGAATERSDAGAHALVERIDETARRRGHHRARAQRHEKGRAQAAAQPTDRSFDQAPEQQLVRRSTDQIVRHRDEAGQAEHEQPVTPAKRIQSDAGEGHDQSDLERMTTVHQRHQRRPGGDAGHGPGDTRDRASPRLARRRDLVRDHERGEYAPVRLVRRDRESQRHRGDRCDRHLQRDPGRRLQAAESGRARPRRDRRVGSARRTRLRRAVEQVAGARVRFREHTSGPVGRRSAHREFHEFVRGELRVEQRTSRRAPSILVERERRSGQDAIDTEHRPVERDHLVTQRAPGVRVIRARRRCPRGQEAQAGPQRDPRRSQHELRRIGDDDEVHDPRGRAADRDREQATGNLR
ncbi:MAG: hypothetical protein ABR975_16775, partial [Vulcanimicrobiaceae bacterium]